MRTLRHHTKVAVLGLFAALLPVTIAMATPASAAGQAEDAQLARDSAEASCVVGLVCVFTGLDLTGDKYIVSGDRATDLPAGFADNVRSWWNVSGNRFCLENYIAETGEVVVLSQLDPETSGNVPEGADGPHGANITTPC